MIGLGIVVGFLGCTLATVVLLWRAERTAPIYDPVRVPNYFPVEWTEEVR